MIGDPINRIDGRQKVTGGATYSAEWPIDGLAYGVIVQSTVAKGQITSMDTREASALPGVLLVMTPENAPRLPQGGRAAVSPPAGRVVTVLQDREVHYNGQPVALVVATTFEQATYAASLVKIAYQEQPPLVDMEKGLASATPVTEKMTGNTEPASSRGDVEGALTAAPVRVEAVYTTPLETHNAMEPHATIAQWDGDRLTLHDSTQYVYGVKRFIAKTLGMPETNVRVISKFVGGAFGSKGSAWSHVVLAAMAAQMRSDRARSCSRAGTCSGRSERPVYRAAVRHRRRTRRTDHGHQAGRHVEHINARRLGRDRESPDANAVRRGECCDDAEPRPPQRRHANVQPRPRRIHGHVRARIGARRTRL